MRARYGIPSLLCLTLIVVWAGGCASAPTSSWRDWMGMAKKEPPGPTIITPRDKMEQLRELAENGATMTPELQERVSSELAFAIPRENDTVLRAEILRTLGNYPTATSLSMLTAGLNDQDREVRIAACDAMGKRGGPEAAQELSKTMLDDSDIDVRLAAARALGATGQANAVPALGHALEDPDPAIQRRAMASLKQTSGRDYGDDLESWRQFVQGKQPEAKQESLASKLFRWF